MKYIIYLFLVLELTGCSTLIETDADFDISNQPDWVVRNVFKASEFWEGHGLFLNVGHFNKPDIEIKVDKDIDNRIGEWRTNSLKIPLNGTIIIHPDLSYKRDIKTGYDITSCIIAHELGHSLFMDHVEQSESLMAPLVGIDKDKTCFWSDLDQEQFCILNPEKC